LASRRAVYKRTSDGSYWDDHFDQCQRRRHDILPIGAIDPQFYPNGIEGWMVKLDAKPEGGVAFDEKFFVTWPAPHRPHQVRLEGGDCSSDSYCYP